MEGQEPKNIIAPQYIDITSPVIFLAGPIQGADNWQEAAARRINDRSREVHVASPRRPGLYEGDFPEELYNEQVDWEHFHLDRAAENGVILFWLAKEKEHRCDRAYAQTTRFELGEAVARHYINRANLVIGIEDGFSNARYIKRTLSKKCPEVPVCETLEQACDVAIHLTLGKENDLIFLDEKLCF